MLLFLRYCLALLVTAACFTAFSQETPTEGLREINGTKLYFKVVGTGEPLLVIHGGPAMNHDYFLPHLYPLAKQYQLIFFDQRASGRSMIPDDSSHSISHRIMVDDIEAIRASFGIKKLNIFAHSWGAKLAVNYALVYGNKVGKIIFSNPVALSHEFDSAQRASIAGKTTEADGKRKKELMASREFMAANLDVYKEVLRVTYKSSFFDSSKLAGLDIVLPREFFRQNAALMKGLMRDMDAYDRNYYASLKEIKVPVLILHGNADHIPLQADERLKSSIPDAHLVVFDSSGHFPFIEENEKFVKTVEDFLR